MKARVLWTVGIVALAGSVVGVLAAQTPTSPAFEVASVKPNKSGDGRFMTQNQPGGRYTATNVTVRMLIQNAYRLQSFQLVGGPTWLTSDHFDIVAQASGDLGAVVGAQNPDPTPLQLMIRGLLADRFKLALHHETRELPVYALVLARRDRKLGPQLRATTVDCAALAAARGRGSAPSPGPPPSDQRPTCGMRSGSGNLVAGSAALSQLANVLSNFLNRTVLDQTGVSGNFDVDLTWTPDQMPQRSDGDVPPIDPNGPSIFTAIQEQLGLKLESMKGPVDVLVIDSAEHPTED